MKSLNAVILLFMIIFTLSCNDNISDYDNLANLEPNGYGLKIISSKEQYLQLVKMDSNFKFVDLEQVIPNIKLDIRYATENNFTGKIVYDQAKAYIRLPVANKLKLIQNELNSNGYGLKIYDAYRPYSISLKFWDIVKDSNFVGTPWGASRHNRGCAVDLSIIDLTTGEEIPMPTEYDDFTDKAHPNNNNFSEEIIKNRKMLIEIMNKHGFTVFPTEWWHYDFFAYKQYPVTDISFNLLDSLK